MILTPTFLSLPIKLSDGTAALQALSAGGDQVVNRNGKARLVFVNSSGLDRRVRLIRQRPDSNGSSDPWDVTVPDGDAVVLEDLNPFIWNEIATGLIYLEYPDGVHEDFEVFVEGRP